MDASNVDLDSLNRENTWLRMQVEQYRKEDEHFNSDQPYIAGTNLISQFVPPIPPFSIRATVSSPSMGGYLIVADAWYFVLNQFIKENATVLDIGCGCGKIARLLLLNPYINKYIGFDTYEKSINWCNENISPFSKGRFEFYYLDVFTKAYNPNGTIKGTEVVFPADDSTVDLVFAASVFTHLVEDDAKHYLQEVKRVLKKDGIFLPSIHTSPAAGSCYSGDEVRIDVDTEYFISLAQSAGLQLEEKLGNLCGQEALLFKSNR
jgi:SAM-dependent methyltransferase